MKKAFFLCFSLIRLIVFSQNKEETPNWVNSSNEQYKYLSCCFYHCEKLPVSKDKFDEKKITLEQLLKTEISKKIQTSVRSLDIREVKQIDNNNKTELQSNYSSSNTISTNVRTLGNTYQLEFWPKNYNKHLKYITGYIKIDRADLEREYSNIVKNELSVLEAELEVNLEESNENLLKISERINVSMSNVSNDLNILTSLITDSDYSIYQQKFIDLKRKNGQLMNKIIGKEFENNYRKANRLLQEKNCIKAYELLNKLNIINPNDNRVSDDKITALHCLETGMLSRITAFENKNEFEDALFTLDSICWLLPKYIKLYENKKANLISNYFEKKFMQIDNVIQTNIDEAKKMHDGIQFFGSDKYKNDYNRYDQLIKKKRKSRLRLEFEYQKDKKQFHAASKTLIQISNDYLGSKNISKEIRKLNKGLESSIYSYEKNELQKDRPHLYCMKLGYNILTPPIPLNDIIEDPNYLNNVAENNLNFLTPYYSFELYRKFKIRTSYTKKHRDNSAANMIGIRIGLLNNASNYDISKSSDSIIVIPPKNDFGEIQLSGIFLKWCHISYGIMVPTTATETSNLPVLIYTSNLGLKIPLWKFDLNANIRYNSDYNTNKNNNFFIEGGLSLNINFYKKFNKEDKREVLVRINEWKN